MISLTIQRLTSDANSAQGSSHPIPTTPVPCKAYEMPTLGHRFFCSLSDDMPPVLTGAVTGVYASSDPCVFDFTTKRTSYRITTP
jgi:hypothetical protein